MRRFLPYLLITLALLCQFAAFAGNNLLKSAKTPDWVTPTKQLTEYQQLEEEAEDGYLDLSFEKQVSLPEQSIYYKKTIKILSQAGVQNSSEISVVFDPSYEQLTFHTISISRNGKVIDKLNLNNFKVLQQEKDLSRHLYNGYQTALLVLDDVRAGDIIESSYTIRGFNPIFEGKYSDDYDLGFGVPVGRIYYKLIAPASRQLTIKNTNTNISPAITIIGNNKIYEYKSVNNKAAHLESKVPSWYNPYPTISVSEYGSWEEVSKWAAKLFTPDVKLSAELQAKISTIKAMGPTDEDRVSEALLFVQDDVRYMGIEMGANSHKPSDPNKIFKQRFGDCKDKSYLLATILNAMGVEAHPVLINTVYKGNTRNLLPSASAFDHCTVQAIVNGKTYWFDPTISYQRGTLDKISYPNYQAGLVINGKSTDLTTIPGQNAGSTVVKEIFTLKDMSGGAKLRVITYRYGSDADDTRYDFKNNSVYEMKKRYKNFYAAYFDKIKADSLTYYENMNTGEFVTTEYYTVDNIWKTENGVKKLDISSYMVGSIMTKPDDKTRTMPFYLLYPAHYTENIEVNMPEPWSVEEFDKRFDCAGFKLHASAAAVGRQVLLNYEYENLKDYINPQEAQGYFNQYDMANNYLGFQLTDDRTTIARNTGSGSNALPTLGTFPKLYILLGLVVVITFMIQRQRQRQS